MCQTVCHNYLEPEHINCNKEFENDAKKLLEDYKTINEDLDQEENEINICNLLLLSNRLQNSVNYFHTIFLNKKTILLEDKITEELKKFDNQSKKKDEEVLNRINDIVQFSQEKIFGLDYLRENIHTWTHVVEASTEDQTRREIYQKLKEVVTGDSTHSNRQTTGAQTLRSGSTGPGTGQVQKIEPYPVI